MATVGPLDLCITAARVSGCSSSLSPSRGVAEVSGCLGDLGNSTGLVLRLVSCLSKKVRWPALLAGIFVCAVSVSCFRTDWIVFTRCELMGRTSIDFYAPPRSPFWLEPSPEQSLPGAGSWEDYRFFDLAKDETLVGKPWLEVNWVAVILRMMVYTAVPYLGFSAILTLVQRLATRWQKVRKTVSSHG